MTTVQQAAESLKLTAQNCYKLKIIDGIIEEMPGGAHRFSEDQFLLVKKIIIENLKVQKNNNFIEFGFPTILYLKIYQQNN